MEKEYKKMINMGWDMSEDKMLKKLSENSKKGWLLKSMNTMNFVLEKGEPQDLIYAMDYQEKLENEEEYLRIFKEAGWSFVCKVAGFRMFSALPGTTPIYTDRKVVKEARKNRLKRVVMLLIGGVFALFASTFIGRIETHGILENVSFIIAIFAAALIGMSVVWAAGLLRNKS